MDALGLFNTQANWKGIVGGEQSGDSQSWLLY